jgi:hypothetical protein
LCAWLIGGLTVYLVSPRPTFAQYFVLVIPFLAILASVGVYAIGSRVWVLGRPAYLVLGVIGLFAVGLVKSAYHDRQYLQPFWRGVEEIGEEVNRVTPSSGLVYAANEAIYFAARRLPPTGLETPDGPELRLSPALAASLHVVSQAQIDERLAEGNFATVVIRAKDPRVESLGLFRLYARYSKLSCFPGDCYIFWGKALP